MTTIYLLTRGSYSDYSVVGVYSSEELAEKQKELLDYQNAGDSQIEEYELDKLLDDTKAVTVIMRHDGTTFHVYPTLINLANGKPHYKIQQTLIDGVHLNNIVLTEDRQTAIKATNELRAQLIALDRWVVGGGTLTCPQCKGTGLAGEELCPTCKGRGKVKV